MIQIGTNLLSQAWLNCFFIAWFFLRIFFSVFLGFCHGGSVPYWSRMVFVLYTWTFFVFSFTTSTVSPGSASSSNSCNTSLSSFWSFSYFGTKRNELISASLRHFSHVFRIPFSIVQVFYIRQHPRLFWSIRCHAHRADRVSSLTSKVPFWHFVLF